MATSIVLSLSLIGKQIAFYGGFLMVVAGISGGILNTIVFVSLRTFRQSSCAFYLMVMSILNIGYMLTAPFSRILLNLYNIDLVQKFLFYCKFQSYASQVCILSSLTCFCLATIDQYCATCPHLRSQKFCNIKLARRLVIIMIFIWFLHPIPYIIFYEHVVSSTTGQVSCTLTNTNYAEYRTYFVVLILFGILPFGITVLFGSMAYNNLRKIPNYTISLIRRELDKQLTIIVLVQALTVFHSLLPYTITNMLVLHSNNFNDPVIQAYIQLASNISIVFFYSHFASPFYIYISVSKRFRRQVFHVFYNVHINRYRQRQRMIINQILPQS